MALKQASEFSEARPPEILVECYFAWELRLQQRPSWCSMRRIEASILCTFIELCELPAILTYMMHLVYLCSTFTMICGYALTSPSPAQ